MNTVSQENILTSFSSVNGATSGHIGPSIITIKLGSSIVKAGNGLHGTDKASFTSPVLYNVIAYL